MELQNKRRLLVLEIHPTSMMYKILYYLRDYFQIKLISLASPEKFPIENYKKIGIDVECFNISGSKYLKNKKFFIGLREIFRIIIRLNKLKKNKPDYVFFRNGPDYFGWLLFKIFKSSDKIYFPYDINSFFYKDTRSMPVLDRNFERYCFEVADYIIHKGPKNELDQLSYNLSGKEIKISPACFDPWIEEIGRKKISSKTKSIAYVGVFSAQKDLRRSIQWPRLFESIAKQNIDLHIYSPNDKYIFKEDNIFVHDSLDNAKLNKILGSYDYGFSIDFLNKKLMNKEYFRTTIGNKIFSYLEAGIPVIVNKDLILAARLIKRYKCGIVIEEKDLPNLKEIIEKQNYPQLLKGVERARRELNMKNEVKKLIKEIV
jgi:hypothetical protein